MEITECKPLDPFEKHVFVVPKQEPVPLIKLDDELLKQGEIPKEFLELTFYEELRRKAIFIKNAVPSFYLILKGKLMKDWKTTLTGLVTLLSTIVAYFGFNVPAEVLAGIIAVGTFVGSLFTRDTASAPAPVEPKSK